MAAGWLALMVGGSLLSSSAQAYGGMQAIQQAKYQRDVLGYAAAYQQALNRIDEVKLDRLREQTLSTQIAQTAASGIQTGVGAPAEIRAETEILSDIDKAILRMSGGVENLRYSLAGQGALAQGYGQGSAMFARGAGTLVDTGTLLASRYWNPKTK